MVQRTGPESTKSRVFSSALLFHMLMLNVCVCPSQDSLHRSQSPRGTSHRHVRRRRLFHQCALVEPSDENLDAFACLAAIFHAAQEPRISRLCQWVEH